MPWTPAQRRLFGAQFGRGEISRKELGRRMREGVRTDVDRTGHAKNKTKSTKRAGRKRIARRASRKVSRR